MIMLALMLALHFRRKDRNKKMHLLVFPWLAHGHISPFLELSRRLANRGVKVSFLSTPRNISKIRPLLLDASTAQIDLVEVALPRVEGLVAGAESTADVPSGMEGVLKTALDGLQKPFEQLLRRLSPDYVIHDFAQYWAATVAAKCGIPAVLFLTFNATLCAYALNPCRIKEDDTEAEELTVAPPDFPSSEIILLPFEARQVVGAFNRSKGQISVVDRFFKSIQECSFIALRSCVEMEGKFIRYLERANGKAVVPLGLLAPDLQAAKKLSEQESSCVTWLDERAASSVVYVSFGSECFLSKEQIRALALGLEATGLQFLWVLRFPRFSNQTASASALLPDGFEARTRERGLVCTDWAPQLQILSHPSVGVFISHAGWSSLVEALKFGVKLVLLPMNLDQGLNARLLVNELDAGWEVERKEDGSFTEDHIQTAVLNAMNEKCAEGRNVKSRFNQLRKNIFGDGGREESYIEEFINRLQLHTPPNNSTL